MKDTWKLNSPIKNIVIHGVSEEMWRKFLHHSEQIASLIDARPGAFVAAVNEAAEAADRLSEALDNVRGKMV